MTDSTATRTITMAEIAAIAGHRPGEDGKLSLPNDQHTADSMAVAARLLVLDGRTEWLPGDPPVGDVTMTGAGPVWAYLAIAHGLHGLASSLTYASPGATIQIWGHGS